MSHSSLPFIPPYHFFDNGSFQYLASENDEILIEPGIEEISPESVSVTVLPELAEIVQEKLASLSLVEKKEWKFPQVPEACTQFIFVHDLLDRLDLMSYIATLLNGERY